MQGEPDRFFEDPFNIVESREFDYETRLNMLQTWLARIANKQAVRGDREEVDRAIVALQAGAKLKIDNPEEQPNTTNYGVVERSDLRKESRRRLLERRRDVDGK